jgi:dihydroorotate dehydrogenase subfamily 2
MNYQAARDLLFLLPPELSHDVSLRSISLAERLGVSSLLGASSVSAPVRAMGLTFANAVGLAAGLDKDGRCIDGLGALGFGALEIGTVTPVPQAGKSKPRLFRLPRHEALINRMGFNNAGVRALLARVHGARFEGVLGINIGKNLATPAEAAVDDYVSGLRAVYPVASYITINISSPNTPGLRDLQGLDALRRLLHALKESRESLIGAHGRSVPLVVKMAPDLTADAIGELCGELLAFDIDGVICGNTTLNRFGVVGDPVADEAGGLSGAPLFAHANAALRATVAAVGTRMTVIGVGGINSAEDAAEKVRLGADLVQLYTGFIYHGPELIGDAARAIAGLNVPA